MNLSRITSFLVQISGLHTMAVIIENISDYHPPAEKNFYIKFDIDYGRN
jgi:hypothetical protein